MATVTGALTGAATLVVAVHIGMGAVRFAMTRWVPGHTLGTLLSLYLLGVAAAMILFGWAMVWAAWRLLRGRNPAAAGLAVGHLVAAVAVVLVQVPAVPMVLSLALLAAGGGSALSVWRGAHRAPVAPVEPLALDAALGSPLDPAGPAPRLAPRG